MNKDKLNELYKKNGLTADDVFKHKFYTIISRSGIDKIQANNNIEIDYQLLHNSADNKCIIIKATDSRLNENTNSYLPIPKSQGFTAVDAADALGKFVKKSNGDPKQDILEDVLSATPPEDGDVGEIIDPLFREALVDAGCSTVNFKEDNYYAGDIITTYRPSGETDPIFRYVRDLMLIFNLLDQFKKFNLRQKNKTIAPNALPSSKITSPALYKAGILNEIIVPFVEAGFLADLEYAKENLIVGINPSNSGRFDVVSPNLITSLLRIVAFDVTVNKFNG